MGDGKTEKEYSEDGLEISGLSDDDLGSDDIDEDELDEANELEKERRKLEAEGIYGSAEEVGGPLEILPAWAELDQSNLFTITRLANGVRDPNRVNIFLDTHFAFSLDIAQVVDFGLKVGKRIDRQELEKLRKASEFGKLYQRTLEWVLTRPHSIRETQNYLKRRQFRRRQLNRSREREGLRTFPEFDDETTKLVVERLIEKKYIDDQKFAEYYVENRYQKKGISHKRLRMELMKKGVARDLIELALEKILRDEDEEIRKVIRKKRRKYDDHKLVAYLVRQGFQFSAAKEAVENYDPDEDNLL